MSRLLVVKCLGRRWKTFRPTFYRYSSPPPCHALLSSCLARQASLYTIAEEPSDFMQSTVSVDVGEPLASDQRILHAAILGVPNVGKTTLINQLLGHKLFAVSPKKHTTIRNAVGVFIEGFTQIILMDTPGIIPRKVGRKLKAPKSFLTGPQRSLMSAELVIVVVDASDKRSGHKLDPYLLQTLAQHSHIPTVLVLNKVDVVRHKHVLLGITESITRQTTQRKRRVSNYKSEPPSQAHTLSAAEHKLRPTPVGEEEEVLKLMSPSLVETRPDTVAESESQPVPDAGSFQTVFMVSALTGDGIADLKEYLVSQSLPGSWEYSMTEHSDQPQLTLVEDIIREKLFHHLHREIPYVVTQSNVIWEEEGDTLVIYQNIVCRSSRQASIVIGPEGRTIQTITAEARADIETLLDRAVDLTLNVKAQK